jgi:Ala-tRNA(Pro) deacylase
MIPSQVMKVLEKADVEFELLSHAHTKTARAEALALGLSPVSVAKTLVLATPEGHVRAVVPASERLDLRKVRTCLRLAKGEVRLLTEAELGRDYPDFELGAVPPFGGAHADRVFVDRRLVDHEQVVLEAGTHEASLRMRTSDLVDLTKARILDLCQK